MAKVMQFEAAGRKPAKTDGKSPVSRMGYKTENDAVLAEQADELIDMFGDMANRLSGMVDSAIEAISDIPERESIEFMLLNPAETENLPEDHPLHGAAAVGKRDEELYIVFTEISDEDGDEDLDGIPYMTGVEKIDRDGNIYNLDKDNNWILVDSPEDEGRESMPWTVRIFEKGGAKAELLDLLLDDDGEITESEWREYCSRYSLLIRLENMTHGLLEMDLTQTGEAVLRASDLDHDGFAIRQEKDSLVLSQWIDRFTMAGFRGVYDNMPPFADAEDIDEDDLPDEYLRDVDTMTISEAKTFCRSYVDRYSHGGLFTFPLSKKKSIRTWADVFRNPDRILRNADTLGELTDREKKALSALKKAVGINA